MPYKKKFYKKSRIKKSIIKNSVIKKITDPSNGGVADCKGSGPGFKSGNFYNHSYAL